MTSSVLVTELSADEWQRYRDIRLAALAHDADAFGGNLESESQFTESQWREKALQYIGLVAVADSRDIGFMTVENLSGDFGATCWVGSCWVNPEFRRRGALAALFAHVDAHAEERDWNVQGLGVWVTNTSAIQAYRNLGFEAAGEPQQSTRKPGMYYQRMIRRSIN
ncbi:MAG: hypothetical protein RL130_308 [Actinomycetota bacterium]|jgi:GNAT superfamily N-acetyltransferase